MERDNSPLGPISPHPHMIHLMLSSPQLDSPLHIF
jgi:hypothetical protein